MIGNTEIEERARELDISPQDVERDYVHGWLLREIFRGALGDRLVLKGGNGIRKGYLVGARYSKDLDFSCDSEINDDDLHDQLQNVLVTASAGSGVKFLLDRTRIAEKRLNIAGVKATEARIYFKGFYAEETRNRCLRRRPAARLSGRFFKRHLPAPHFFVERQFTLFQIVVCIAFVHHRKASSAVF
jgi:predicted nucleotidyltransferase component of viral defense system